jgi:transcriptional antiterminator Rof (Rho-off)
MQESQSFIAWWGAVISSILAGIRIFEFWRERFRIEVSCTLRGGESLGNTIQIRNISSKPIIVSSWEVVYVSGRWPFDDYQDVVCSDHDSGDLRIESHSTLELNFTGQDYFSWSQKDLCGRRVFIRIYIAGRGSVFKLLYSP